MTRSATSGEATRSVAISGATGLVGRALVPAFEHAGYACRRLVRRGAPGAAEVAWNPESGTIDAAALEGVDVVVHLAGENIAQRWTAASRRAILDSRVRGTSLLARAIAGLRRPPRVMISMSAVGVYGSRGGELLDEYSSHGDDFLAQVCDAWEAAATPVVTAGVRLITPRMGIVLAREGGALAPMLRVFRLGLGGRLGSGRQWMSWIARTDVVRALLFLADASTISGAVNLVAPNPVDNAEFTRALSRALGRPAIFPVPAVALSAVFGRMARETILASQRVQPRRLTGAGFDFALPSLDAALKAELIGTRDEG